MIIEIVNKKYYIGSNRGVAEFNRSGILRLLNGLIEWDFSKFPNKKSELVKQPDGTEKEEIKEDREFLGVKPELKPGNVFLLKGQLIAVDSPDRLILLISETGPRALDRVWESIILPESDLKFNNFLSTEINWAEVTDKHIPTDYIKQSVDYNLYNIWKERFIDSRSEIVAPEIEMTIQINLNQSENIVIPVVFYLKKYHIYFPKTIHPGQISSLVEEIFAWFYENYDRTKGPNDPTSGNGYLNLNKIPIH